MDIKEVKEEIVDKAKEFSQMEKEWYAKNKSKGVLDAIQEKVVSRKLLVFLTATSLFVWAGLDPDTWGMIAMCYIGGQAAIDFAKVWKG
jgi:hypothetical protein